MFAPPLTRVVNRRSETLLNHPPKCVSLVIETAFESNLDTLPDLRSDDGVVHDVFGNGHRVRLLSDGVFQLPQRYCGGFSRTSIRSS